MPITLEEAVEIALDAREEWSTALMQLAVAQYHWELVERLGIMAFLLNTDEANGKMVRKEK